MSKARNAQLSDEAMVRYLRREASLLLGEHSVRWHRKEIEDTVTDNDIIIVTGAPGCGKSTQVPIFVSDLEFMRGKTVLCTQPHRMAAEELSKYVRNIFNGSCFRVHGLLKSLSNGDENAIHGCNGITLQGAKAEDGTSGVAFLGADCQGASDSTRIAYASEMDVINAYRVAVSRKTDSALGSEGALVPDATVGCIVLDEAHARTVESDILLSLASKAVGMGIKVVVMSATIDSKAFSDYFARDGNALCVGQVNIKDQRNWVDIMHVPPAVPFTGPTLASTVVSNITSCLRGSLCGPLKGNILVFLPTDGHIEQAKRLLERSTIARSMPNDATFTIVTMTDADGHLEPASNLGSIDEDENSSGKPAGGARNKGRGRGKVAAYKNKNNEFVVYLATEFAETSLTIDGVTVVIDPGLRSASEFNAKTHLAHVSLKSISQASAEQRKGRAGRTRPGHCVRLYSHNQLKRFAPANVAAVLCQPLQTTVLCLASLGHSPSEFRWFDPPS